jgi:equilibrative nucleoside transporter 1/2/3
MLSFDIFYFEKANLARRIIGSLSVTSAVFLVCILTVPLRLTPEAYFKLTLSLILTTGVCAALANNGVFGTAAQLPPRYIQAVSIGNAVAGVAVSLAQIAIIVFTSNEGPRTPDAENKNAFYYFLNTFFVMAVSVLVFLLIQRSPFYAHYVCSPKTLLPEDQTEAFMESAASVSSSSAQSIGEVEEDDQSTGGGTLSSTLGDISSYVLAMFLLFSITLSVFPAITSSVSSVNTTNTLLESLFVPLHFLLFNGGDWIGRLLASVSSLQIRHGRSLILASVARVLFYPLLLACNVIVKDAQGAELERFLPLIFNSDACFWFIMAAFSISHGWLCSLIMMAAPQKCHISSKALAGTLLVSCLSIGMAVGSFLSFGIRAIMCRCNPFLS